MTGNNDQIFTILLLVALGFLIHHLTRPKTIQTEKFTDSVVSAPDAKSNVSAPSAIQPAAQPTTQPAVQQATRVVDNQPKGETNDLMGFGASDMDGAGADLSNAYEPPIPHGTDASAVDINKNNVKKYDSKDFLPKEINDKWFDTDFSQAKFNVNDDKLINTERYVVGINTVGQSLKNASYDIRGTIPNPKFSVSPWNNSTYEPDTNIKPMC